MLYKEDNENIILDTHLKSHARKVLFGDTTASNDNTIPSGMDMNILDTDVLKVLGLSADASDVDLDSNVEGEDINIGLDQTIKVRKLPMYDMIADNIYAKGITKMIDMNLPVVRLGRKKRVNRE